MTDLWGIVPVLGACFCCSAPTQPTIIETEMIAHRRKAMP